MRETTLEIPVPPAFERILEKLCCSSRVDLWLEQCIDEPADSFSTGKEQKKF